MKENPLRQEKRRKLHELREKGHNPYPYKFEKTHEMKDLREKYQSLEEGEKDESAIVKVAGRLMTKRPMGKASFFNMQDEFSNIQVYLRKDSVDEKSNEIFSLVDIGDIVGVTGYMFKTKKGEVSIHASSFEMLCKTLEPLPEKFHGLTDIEMKYRYRHLDLVMDPGSREVFRKRAIILREIRRFLDERGFLEVETPILQSIYGGAAAHPFKTHHRSLDMELFLKISPETYLKRLVVGGFEKVYDMNRNFRNEGIDRTHNPEFTMIEWYEAYTDYNDQMERVEQMVEELAMKVCGTTEIEYKGKALSLKAPWRRLSMYDAISEYGKMNVRDMSDSEIFDTIKKHGSELEKPSSRGEMITELFELVAEEHLWQPTFLTDYPVEVSPLTKHHREDHSLVERFELFIAGMELANSYSELNDPEEQLKRFK